MTITVQEMEILVGTRVKVAQIIGITPQCLWNWIERKEGEIPFKERCVIKAKFPTWFTKEGEFREDIRQALTTIGTIRDSL